MLLICSTTYGGCGFVGSSSEFDGDGDNPRCAQCHSSNATRGLTADNQGNLAGTENKELAVYLLGIASGEIKDYPMAQCGCWHHAEDGVPCAHDIALSREVFMHAVVA
jgi:hypothetical protein